MQDLRPGYTYTDNDWNPITHEEGADPNLDLTAWPPRYRNYVLYMASKKLAEKAVWDFYKQEKPSWRLSVVCPSFIGGPSILPLAKGPASLAIRNSLIWMVASSKPDDKLMEPDALDWVRVRDVAKAHVEALVRSEAKGKRFVVTAHKMTNAKMAGVLRENLGIECSRDRQEVESFMVEASNCGVLGLGSEWVGFEYMVCHTVRQVLDMQKGSAGS